MANAHQRVCPKVQADGQLVWPCNAKHWQFSFVLLRQWETPYVVKRITHSEIITGLTANGQLPLDWICIGRLLKKLAKQHDQSNQKYFQAGHQRGSGKVNFQICSPAVLGSLPRYPEHIWPIQFSKALIRRTSPCSLDLLSRGFKHRFYLAALNFHGVAIIMASLWDVAHLSSKLTCCFMSEK